MSKAFFTSAHLPRGKNDGQCIRIGHVRERFDAAEPPRGHTAAAGRERGAISRSAETAEMQRKSGGTTADIRQQRHAAAEGRDAPALCELSLERLHQLVIVQRPLPVVVVKVDQKIDLRHRQVQALRTQQRSNASSGKGLVRKFIVLRK